MRLYTDQRGVVQAVIAAFELENLVTTGRGTSQSASMHGSFGAARPESNHLDRKALADFFRQLPLHVVRHAEHRARAQTWLDRFHHRRMAMSGHESAKAEVVIDVVVAIQIAEVRALSLFHENRMRLVSTIVAGNAERNAFQVLLVCFGGLGCATHECIEFAL